MRMQVILDSLFARPGSAPIGGGKKVEFRDWTMFAEIWKYKIAAVLYFGKDLSILKGAVFYL